jgi:hypothetical protein
MSCDFFEFRNEDFPTQPRHERHVVDPQPESVERARDIFRIETRRFAERLLTELLHELLIFDPNHHRVQCVGDLLRVELRNLVLCLHAQLIDQRSTVG